MLRDQFYNAFQSVVQTPGKYAVLSHVNPDGDAIGSSLALSHFLQKLGHPAEVMVPNDFPGFLAWMPGASAIHIYDKDPDGCDKILNDADTVFILDFNHFSRSGAIKKTLEALETPKILIDHHRDADLSLFAFALTETAVSSTSELVAETLLHCGEQHIDDAIATNLLVGIMTDTGSFSHSIYHPQTFAICAKLIEKGPSYNHIHQQIYDTFSENRLRLLGHSISHKMEILDEYATAIIALDKEELAQFNYQVGDTEGVVNFPLQINKVRMSVLVTERQDVIRFSFRSKGNFSVHELAQKYFNGGGHTNAAGGTLNCSMEAALDQLHRVLPEFQTRLLKD